MGCLSFFPKKTVSFPMKLTQFLCACFLLCSMGATAQIGTFNTKASATSFFGKEYPSESIKLSRFLENLDIDINLPDLSQAKLNPNGKELRKSLHLDYYDYLDYLTQLPIEKIIYPDLNYLGGHMVDRYARNFFPDPKTF